MNNQNTHRHSRQRDCILETLRDTTSHPTAKWIYDKVREKIPNISLGTVYRNLAVLCNDGMVIKIDVGDGTERYDAGLTPHYHLHCRKCGCVSDIHTEYAAALDKNAESEYGCKIDRHSLLFSGVCADCIVNL